MRLSCLSYLSGLILLVAISACSEKSTETTAIKESERAVPVDLAFALEQRAGTKASVTTIKELQNAGYFRGMEDIHIIPFSTGGVIGPGDRAVGFGRKLPSISGTWDRTAYTGAASYHDGLIYNNHAHLYSSSFASMPERTSSVLVYGRGPVPSDELSLQEKHLYGSVIETGLGPREDFLRAEDIHFYPEPILTGSTPTLGADITALLNAIAEAATYTQTYYYNRNDQWYEETVAVSWNESLEEPLLRGYFEWFTNNGELMAGSGGCVRAMLSGLYTRLSLYYSSDNRPLKQLAGGLEYPVYPSPGSSEQLTYKKLYDGLRDVILERFTALERSGAISIDNLDVELDGELSSYPESLGLPPGSAVVRWNGVHFVVVTESLDGIAAMDRFCFMPPLFYYVNTTISTSANPEIYKNYTENSLTWESILSTYRQGKQVRSNTRSVALDNPLRFANGLIAITITASAASVPDRTGKMVAVGGVSFPVTGIILGGQYAQQYNFTPDKSSGEYYLYDKNVSGIYLKPVKSADFRSLVMPTPDEEDVYFCLELRNDSDITFTGAEGLIYPGNHFYLVGKLVYEEGKDTQGNPNAFPAVFVKDYMTKVDCTVSSLEYAHITIPDLHTPHLMLGVQTELNWIMSTGTFVVLN